MLTNPPPTVAVVGDGEQVGAEDSGGDDGPEDSDTPAVGRYGFPAGFHALREGAVVCGIVAVVVAVVYQVWHLHPGVPVSYSGDGLLNATFVKSIRENGWMLSNPRLGAPFHGALYDFPQGGENAQFLLEKLIGYVTPSYGATENVFFFATFFLVALSAYFTARYLKLGVGACLIVATLYTLLPYHLWHGEGHVTRSGYYIVPLTVLVILWLTDYRSRYCEEHRLAFVTHRWRFVAAIAICLVLGGSDTQNSLFTVSLLASIAVLLALANRDFRPLVIGAALCAVILFSLTLNNLPTLLYERAHGVNPIAAHRPLNDVDLYSLSFSRLLLPNRGYRIGRLASLEVRSSSGIVPGESGEALGLIGAIGLIVTLAAAGLRIFGARRAENHREDRNALGPLLARLGGASLIAVLFATTGGLSRVIALAGFTSLRTWNRIVVYIGAFSLLAVGLLLDRWFRVLRGRFGRAGVVAIATIVVVAIAFGAFDQTSAQNVPPYAATARKFGSDDAFFTTLEARLPHAAMVFEYPIMTFPESAPSGIVAQGDQLIGYLHTKDLRWSYGAMSGRPESNWQQALSVLPVRTAMFGLAAANFAGVFINRAGYTNAGTGFENTVRATLGPPTLVSDDQALAYYDLTPLRRTLDQLMSSTRRKAFRDAILHPVTTHIGAGFYPIQANATGSWQWVQQDAQFTLNNPSAHPAKVAVSAQLGASPGTVTITGLGSPRTLTVSPSRTPFSVDVAVPPGATTVRFHTDAPRSPAPGDPRVLYLQVFNLIVRPPTIDAALCTFEVGATRPLSCPAAT